MKANRKFIEADDEAVSAVIGVILMVAITVAIAATVYVYVSGMIGTSPESAPEIQFVKDDVNDKLTVAKAEPGNLQWNNLYVKVSGNSSAIKLYFNGATDVTSHATGSSADGIVSSNTVNAGDYLNLTISSGDSCTVTIRHVDTNTLLGTWDFHG